jgi:hypothetical protein
VGFVVYNLWQVFSKYFGFPCQFSFYKLLLLRFLFLYIAYKTNIDFVHIKFVEQNQKSVHHHNVCNWLRTTFRISYIDVFIIYICTKFHIPSSSGLLSLQDQKLLKILLTWFLHSTKITLRDADYFSKICYYNLGPKIKLS